MLNCNAQSSTVVELIVCRLHLEDDEKGEQNAHRSQTNNSISSQIIDGIIVVRRQSRNAHGDDHWRQYTC